MFANEACTISIVLSWQVLLIYLLLKFFILSRTYSAVEYLLDTAQFGFLCTRLLSMQSRFSISH